MNSIGKTLGKANTIASRLNGTIRGGLPEEWKVQRLEKVCSHFKSGFGITSERIFAKGDFPVYGGNGLRGYTDSYTHEGNYILIGRQGALCGNIQLVSGRFYASEHAIAVQVNDSNDLTYLSYKLAYKNLNRLSESSAQPGLSVAKLERLKIDLPPHLEQIRIGKILKTWDVAIDETQRLIDQIKLRNKGLAQQLLNGKKRLKGFEGEWRHDALENYFKERNEVGYLNLPLLSVGETGVYPQSESNKKDTSNEDKGLYKRICPGDIGYNTMRMWQGRSALSNMEGIVSPAYTIVTPRDNAEGKFFSYLFKLNEVVHKFYRNSQGLVSDTLNCKFRDFKIVKVDIPPTVEEQRAIAEVLIQGEYEVRLLTNKLQSMLEQKKGLMQKLLTGEVRVNQNN